MRAYYFADRPEEDQRLPHDAGSAELSAADLSQQLGVQHFRFDDVADVDALAAARGYKNRDEITVSPEAMGGAEAYEARLRTFFDEHLHEDEEIRYVRGGRGYFDVRDREDRWVRIAVEKGDLIILPAGIYHRFTTDESNYIHAMRLFKEEPKWTPLNRSQELDANPFRKEYVSGYLS